jgi:hypothetical protein
VSLTPAADLGQSAFSSKACIEYFELPLRSPSIERSGMTDAQCYRRRLPVFVTRTLIGFDMTGGSCGTWLSSPSNS